MGGSNREARTGSDECLAGNGDLEVVRCLKSVIDLIVYGGGVIRGSKLHGGLDSCLSTGKDVGRTTIVSFRFSETVSWSCFGDSG